MAKLYFKFINNCREKLNIGEIKAFIFPAFSYKKLYLSIVFQFCVMYGTLIIMVS